MTIFDTFVERTFDWYFVILLILMITSLFSVAGSMKQERNNSDTDNISRGDLIVNAGSEAPKGKIDVLMLMFSGFLLYCHVFNLSRDDFSLISFLLYFGGGLFMLFMLFGAAIISEWMDFESRQ